ncbi:MAG: hypothetical protein HOJ88_04185 [Proteobacteria bacterium]|nr:hypothetical protein [Pseudomonadota bacterium]
MLNYRLTRLARYRLVGQIQSLLANVALVTLASMYSMPAAYGQSSSLGGFEDSVCPDNAYAVFHQCALEAAKTAEPPRTPGGRPDFSGNWLRRAWAFEDFEAHPKNPDDFGGPSAIVDPVDGKYPLQPWAIEINQKNIDAYVHQNAACFLSGPAGTMYMTSRFTFLQDDQHLVMIGEQLNPHPSRIIPVDGRPHIGDISLWNGDSRGHWDGNTLVIESPNHNAKYFLDQRGRFITDEARIVERMTWIDNNTIHYSATFDDPNVFTRPLTIAFAFRRNTIDEGEIWEEACFETNGDPMNLYRSAGKKVYSGMSGVEARELKAVWEASQ